MPDPADPAEVILPEDPQARSMRGRYQELYGVREARRSQGQIPTVGRRVLLQSPIWFDARVARKFITTSWIWDVPTATGTERRGISSINNEPLAGRPGDSGRGHYETGGLLRWVDLDLMLALSYHWQETGKPFIAIDQKTALSWVGYESLEDPPFEELRSSIWRLQATQFRHFTERPAGGYQMRILQPLLMNPTTYHEGKRAWLTTTIGEGWLSEMRADNQAVDLRAYLNLVRAIRMADASHRRRAHQRAAPAIIERPPDIARSVLLFLDSLRQVDQQTSVVKMDWLQERFGDRKISIPQQNLAISARLTTETKDIEEIGLDGPRGLPDPQSAHYEFSDPLNPHSKIRTSLESLGKLQIISGYSLRGDRLEVRWADPSKLAMPRIATTLAQQTRLVEVDRLTGQTRMVDGEGLPPVAPSAPTPSARLPAPPQPPASPRAPAAPPATDLADVMDPGTLLPELQRIVTALAKEYVGLNRRRLAELAGDGWQQQQLLALIVTTIYHTQEQPLPGSRDKVLIPRQFILAKLKNDSPDAWKRTPMRHAGFDPDQIMDWFNQPGGLREQLGRTR